MSYISRLKRVMRERDGIIADPEGHEELQVKAGEGFRRVYASG